MSQTTPEEPTPFPLNLAAHVKLCRECDAYFDVRHGCPADLRKDERGRVRQAIEEYIDREHWPEDGAGVECVAYFGLLEVLDRIAPGAPPRESADE